MEIKRAIEAAQDPRRLDVLRDLNLLDSAVEEAYDRLTRLASKITNSPISLVSLIDADRQFFLSLIGLPENVARDRQTPLSHSFCKHVVEDNSPLIIEDAREHPVLKDNLAIPELGVISYLGMPLTTSDGTCLGSFCVIDTVPRKWSEREIEIVRELAVSVMAEIELRIQIESRKKIEAELRSSKSRTQSIIAGAMDGVIVIDDQSRIMQWNEQAAQIFGWSHSEAVGRSLAETIIPPTFREAHLTGVQHHQRTGEGPILNQRIEIRALHRRGHEFHVELSVSPLSEGHQTYYSAFVRDISEEKARQAELQEAKELAEHATLAKSTFLANMSHEIRTPLNSIIGLSSLLMDSEMAPEHAEYVLAVSRSGRSLLEIINNILDFSKLEAGRLELEEQPFILSDFLQSTIELLDNESRQKGLELRWNISDDTPEAYIGDVTRLRQVLVNLLSNAVKFTQYGGVSIQVNGDLADFDHFRLHFLIKDSGIGIPENRIDQLFEAFSQVDASVTRRYGGTGLGLAICRELVELMGGRIWVESKLGSGSTFHFSVTLPVTEVDHVTSDEDDFQGGKVMSINHPLSILIAEDDAGNQMVTLHMLKKLGYHADVAANGLEALAALRRQHYDVILMDHQMPEMDGVTAMEHIRSEWSVEKQPRIIAMTAEAMEGDRERFLESGMDDYVPKPVMMSELTAALIRSFPEHTQASAPLEDDGVAYASEDYEPIDTANFEERLGPGSAPVLSNLVDLFIQEAEPKLVELRRAAEDGNGAEIESIAHRLSGSSSNTSALQFAAKCQLLCNMVRERDLARAVHVVIELEQEYERIIQWQLHRSPH